MLYVHTSNDEFPSLPRKSNVKLHVQHATLQLGISALL